MADKIHPDSLKYIAGYNVTAREWLASDASRAFRTTCPKPTLRKAREWMRIHASKNND